MSPCFLKAAAVAVVAVAAATTPAPPAVAVARMAPEWVYLPTLIHLPTITENVGCVKIAWKCMVESMSNEKDQIVKIPKWEAEHVVHGSNVCTDSGCEFNWNRMPQEPKENKQKTTKRRETEAIGYHDLCTKAVIQRNRKRI